MLPGHMEPRSAMEPRAHGAPGTWSPGRQPGGTWGCPAIRGLTPRGSLPAFLSTIVCHCLPQGKQCQGVNNGHCFCEAVAHCYGTGGPGEKSGLGFMPRISAG